MVALTVMLVFAVMSSFEFSYSLRHRFHSVGITCNISFRITLKLLWNYASRYIIVMEISVWTRFRFLQRSTVASFARLKESLKIEEAAELSKRSSIVFASFRMFLQVLIYATVFDSTRPEVDDSLVSIILFLFSNTIVKMSRDEAAERSLATRCTQVCFEYDI